MHDHHHAVTVTTPTGASLTIALVLIGAFLVAEVVAAVVAGSLALLADAGHMLTDAGALAFALFAATLAARPAQGRWTFGYKRLEILAAQANGVTLLVVALLIVFGAVAPADHAGRGARRRRARASRSPGSRVNAAATAVLSRASRESLNVRGAFLHVATDMVAFVGTAIAGALILVTGWDRFDPIASLGVAALMLWASWGLLHESASIFLERSPTAIDPEAVGRALVAEHDVVQVHDLHVWTVTSGFPALAAHVLVAPEADCHARAPESRADAAASASRSSTRRCRSSTRNRGC